MAGSLRGRADSQMEINNSELQAILDKITELRHELHRIPEASMKEYKTKQAIMAFIADNTALEIVDCGAWFYAVKKSEASVKRGAIAFRADMDAVCGRDGLPGHYCGHDGHSSILAGLAVAIDGADMDRDVYLIFQPGEETGEGAKICSQLIKEKNIEEIYGLHNIPGHAFGNILVSSPDMVQEDSTESAKEAADKGMFRSTFACASTGLEISLYGRPSHAAYPEAGINPGPVLAKLLLDIEELTRRVNEQEGFVLMTLIGMEVGSANYGVAASGGTLRLTVRGEKEDIFDSYVERIKKLVLEASAQSGTRMKFEELERFPATENYAENVEKVTECAEKLGLTVERLKEPMRWSEDFGWYLMMTKGAFFGIGDGEAYAQLHTQDYEFPDGIMGNAVRLFAGLI